MNHSFHGLSHTIPAAWFLDLFKFRQALITQNTNSDELVKDNDAANQLPVVFSSLAQALPHTLTRVRNVNIPLSSPGWWSNPGDVDNSLEASEIPDKQTLQVLYLIFLHRESVAAFKSVNTLFDGTIEHTSTFVSIPSMNNCWGVTVYVNSDSDSPTLPRPGSHVDEGFKCYDQYGRASKKGLQHFYGVVSNLPTANNKEFRAIMWPRSDLRPHVLVGARPA